MKYHIQDAELTLLLALRERAPGFGEHSKVPAGDVTIAAGLEPATMRRALTYLEGYGLAGATFSRASMGGAPGQPVLVWITSVGENYLREVESQPGVPAKLTAKGLAMLDAVARGVVVKAAEIALTAWMKAHGAGGT